MTKPLAVSVPSDNAVDAVGISKRFRFHSGRSHATIKDLVVRRVHREKRWDVVKALDDVTFSVGRGQTLGIIGQNGSGKTTLLRILSGIMRPDRGQVRVRGNVAPMLALGTGFNPFLTGRENALIELLMLGLSRQEARQRLQDVIEFSELAEFMDAPMRTYSTGMIMRLGFAAAIQIDPEILLIDEVLSVGDERFAVKCQAWLDDFKSRGRTTVLVTHSTGLVASQCDVALWLNNGKVGAFGDPTSVVHEYVQAMHATGNVAAANGAPYQVSMTHMMRTLRLPLIGQVRQDGEVNGIFGDGWTDGVLEFTIEPLRDVRGWMVRATIPTGMPETESISAEIDGSVISSAPSVPGEVLLRCERFIKRGEQTTIRIKSSATVNPQAAGLSGDTRDLGARIDEIVFEH